MDDVARQAAEESEAPSDLRAELFENISTKFCAELEADGSLPTAAQQALVKLLDIEAPTASEIIAAVSRNDSDEEEASDE